MSEVYNPETVAYEKMASLEIDAKVIKAKLDNADSPEERDVLQRQLDELQRQVDSIRRRFRRDR